MKKSFFALLLAAALVPFAAVPSIAQTPPDTDGPPAAVRAQLDQIRTTYKTNAFNALGVTHRNQVNAIISQVNAGTLDRRTAATQIDQILSPAEAQAVLAQGKSMHDAMRKVFEANAPQNDNGPGGERPHAPRTPDAGRMLVMLGANRPMRPPGQPEQP